MIRRLVVDWFMVVRLVVGRLMVDRFVIGRLMVDRLSLVWLYIVDFFIFQLINLIFN